ncbi:MAG: COX15/CtaA family protein [Maricaulaceae bacterium]|jgi:cytochrome c oxidase assembly protein subunit 15
MTSADAHEDASGRDAAAKSAASPAVAAWLATVCVLVVAIIMVGGLTRLTDSGLSITEWDVVMGTLPPLGEAAWGEAFRQYQQTTEYQQLNFAMTLAEFKTIFWWEWGHRLLGRVIGMIYLVGLVVFWIRGRLPAALKPRFVAIFILIGFQGAIGWWMVTSGLVGRLDVSQHRLAAHLMTAFLILAVTWWTFWDVRAGEVRVLRPASRLGVAAAAMMLLVTLQIALGAYVAGLDGGRVYTQWPLINGAIAPADYAAFEPFWRNLVDNPLTVQINHRYVGYAVVLAGLAIWLFGSKGASGRERAMLGLLAAACAGQAALGVTTLVNTSPIELSSMHQLGAVAVFLIAVVLVRETAVSRRLRR